MPTSQLRNRISALVALAFLVAGPASAGGITDPLILPSVEGRSVFADAVVASGPQFSSQSNGDGSQGDFAPTALHVEASADIGLARADGSASQDSTIDEARISASGNTAASASSEAEDGFGSATGDSLFELTFGVSSSVTFDLVGMIFATASGDENGGTADSRAFVELLDGNGAPILSFSASPGEMIQLDESGTLFAGIAYQLVISAQSFADVLGGSGAASTAAFDVELIVVPEPSSGALFGLGLGALAFRRRPL